jgi:hypothetical protein
MSLECRKAAVVIAAVDRRGSCIIHRESPPHSAGRSLPAWRSRGGWGSVLFREDPPGAVEMLETRALARAAGRLTRFGSSGDSLEQGYAHWSLEMTPTTEQECLGVLLRSPSPMTTWPADLHRGPRSLLAVVLAVLVLSCSTPGSPTTFGPSPSSSGSSITPLPSWPCDALTILDSAQANLIAARSNLAVSNGGAAKNLAQLAYSSSAALIGTLPPSLPPTAGLGEVRFKIIATSLSISEAADVLRPGTSVPTADDLPPFDQGLVVTRLNLASAHQAVAAAAAAGLVSCSP